MGGTIKNHTRDQIVYYFILGIDPLQPGRGGHSFHAMGRCDGTCMTPNRCQCTTETIKEMSHDGLGGELAAAGHHKGAVTTSDGVRAATANLLVQVATGQHHGFQVLLVD